MKKLIFILLIIINGCILEDLELNNIKVKIFSESIDSNIKVYQYNIKEDLYFLIDYKNYENYNFYNNDIEFYISYDEKTSLEIYIFNNNTGCDFTICIYENENIKLKKVFIPQNKHYLYKYILGK